MAQYFKTFLDLTNAVMRRMREDEVSTTAETAYSKMIGFLVQDAVAAVSQATAWPSLRGNAQITSAAGTAEYLTVPYEDGAIFSVVDDAARTQLKRIGLREMIKLQRTEQSGGRPMCWAITRIGAIRQMYISLYPTPTEVRTYTYDYYRPEAEIWQGEQFTDASYVLAPSEPITLLAYAYALQERGEDNRRQYNEVMNEYRKVLSQHIVNTRHLNGVEQWRVN